MPLSKHYDLARNRKKFPERFVRYMDLESRPDNDRVAANVLGYAIEGVLCGYADEGIALAERCLPLIAAGSELSPERASAQFREPKERFLHGAESYRLWYLALAQWITDVPCTGTYRAAVEQIEIADRCEKSVHFRESADHYMELAIQIGDDSHALAYYQKTCRDAHKHLIPKTAKSVRRICEAICRHRLNGEFSTAEIRSALDIYLHRHVDSLLVQGWACGVADLLKIRCELDGITSPVEVLQRAAEYLPGSQLRRTKYEVILNVATAEIAW